MKTYMPSATTVEKKWYVVDATDMTLGRLASNVANVLRGKNKPIYTPNIDTGDYVIVINAEKIRVSGNKLNDKVYDLLKWICMVVIPALTTAYVGLSAIWGWPYATEIAKTSAVVCTLFGALLGISTATYYKDGNESGSDHE